jgi:hypothetical protein
MDDRPTTTAAEAVASDESEAVVSTALARDQASGDDDVAISATTPGSVPVEAEQREEQEFPVVPSEPPIDRAASHAVRQLEASLADLRADLREELRVTLEQSPSTEASPDAVIESVFDASAVTDRIDDIERMMTELLSSATPPPESTAPEATPTAPAASTEFTSAEPVPEAKPPAATTLDEAIASAEQAAVPADPMPEPPTAVEPALAPAAEATSAPEPPPDRAGEALQPTAAPEAPAGPKPEPQPAAKPRRSLLSLVEQSILAPLRAVSAPMTLVPASLRPLVSAFALTLPLWIPAFWWLSQQVAAAERVRPLDVTELTALTEALHPVEGAAKSEKEGHGGKAGEKKGSKAEAGHESKGAKGAGAAQHEGGKEAAKSGGHEAEAKKAPPKKEAAKKEAAKAKAEHAKPEKKEGGH